MTISNLPRKTALFLAIIFNLFISVSAQADSNPSDNPENKQPHSNSTVDPGFSIYGNWCGLNHPADINNAQPPIDLLDTQCQTHDLCYVKKGDFDCGCDRNMVLEIDMNQKQRRYTREQYLIAQNIKLHFALSPCEGEVDGNKALPTRVLTRVYKGTKRRIMNTYDRFIGRHFDSSGAATDNSQK